MPEESIKFKFAMVFSGGKDSAIALSRMVRDGHTPVCLVMAADMQGLSHMHFIRPNLMHQYGEALGLPVALVRMEEKYDFDAWRKTMESIISQYGAEAVCTGDIAFAYSRSHIMEMAESFGLKAFTPLWGIGEDELIREILGMEIIIKSLSAHLDLNDLLGKRLDEDAIARLHEKGLRLCEDTSDLHTLAVNGPIFQKPLRYQLGRIIQGEKFAMIDIHSADVHPELDC